MGLPDFALREVGESELSKIVSLDVSPMDVRRHTRHISTFSVPALVYSGSCCV